MTTTSGQFGELARLGESVSSWLGDGSAALVAVAAMGVLTGLTLWLIGGRALWLARFYAAGALGGVATYLVLRALMPGADFTTQVFGVLLGIVAGLVLCAMLFRVSMAVVLGVVLGLAAPTSVALALGVHASFIDGGRDGTLGEESLLMRGVPVYGDEDAPSAVEEADAVDADEVARLVGARVRAFGGALAQEGKDRWETLDASDRAALLGAALLGAAIGFGLGMFAPRFAAGGVTAATGAALWLSCGAWLFGTLRPEDKGSLPSHALAWALIWFVVAAIGAFFQWAPLVRKPVKKIAPIPNAQHAAA